MDIYFYNSYSLSTKGFELVKVNAEEKETILMAKENKEFFSKNVVMLFSTGGASMVLSKAEDDKYMFMIKNIQTVDRNIDDTVPGRIRYYNVAFEANSNDKSLLCKLIIYVLCSYKSFIKALPKIVEISTGELSYNINFDSLNKIIEDAGEYFKTDLNNIIIKAEKPFDFDFNAFSGLIRDVYKENINDEFTLLVFERTKEYFEKMNSFNDVNAKYMFNSDGSIYDLKNESVRDESIWIEDNKIPKKIIAAGIAIAVIGGAIGLIRRKRKKRRNYYV